MVVRMRYVSLKERYTIAMSIFPIVLWINAILTAIIVGDLCPMNWILALFITLCSLGIWIITI